MNLKFLMALASLVAFLLITTVQADQGLALTWENSAGFWFACGPVQCIQAGEKTEEEALDRVINDGRHSVSSRDTYGRCNRYVVQGMESYDNSSEKVKRLAKCY